MIRSSSILPLFILIICSLQSRPCLCVRIGVIGGGISGSFVSKYLVDYLEDCSSLEALTIFDPHPLGEFVEDTSNNDDWQGSRVSSYRLDDGRIVELGASVLTDQFKLILEMAKGGNLTVGPPFYTGFNESKRDGMVIYNGKGQVMFNTANSTTSTMRAMAWRYNMDLIKLYRITSKIIDRFDAMQDMLLEKRNYFFESPQEMWDEANLGPFVHMSIDDLCDFLWIPKVLPWWRRLVPGQGSIRSELLESMLLVNYNQGNSQINAVTGLGSFSASSHSMMHSIVGGNARLISSAFAQAQTTHSTKCPDTPNIVSHSKQRVSTVVGSLDGFEVFASDGSLLGHYDILVLAAPLAMSRVEFLINSHIDTSVLQPMPMGGLVENAEDTRYADDHEGHNPLPHHLSRAATRTYTQVVTTLVRHAELQHDYFSIDPEHIPRVIVFTQDGKASEHNITSIAQISPKDGLYKIFSSQPLTMDVLHTILGSAVKIEYQKIWGGKHGGATPDYQGTGGDSTNFLLYDGATGFSGHTTSGALYYPNSLELSFACIELSAMGAKAVAKLIAKRLGWVTYEQVNELGEEL